MSQNNQKRKPGPKTDWYRDQDNKTVDGLRQKDKKRWRSYLPDGTIREFRCDDAKQAISRHLQWMSSFTSTLVHAKVGQVTPVSKALLSVDETTEQIRNMVDFAFKHGLSTHIQTEKAPAEWDIFFRTYEPIIWNWVRKQIEDRPKYVARQTGIEQIGYLDRVKQQR